MATAEQETSAREDLKAVLNDLSAMKAGNLARRELGPDLSFESGVIYFSRLLRLFHILANADLSDVSYTRITQLTGVANQTRDLFRSILNFSVTKYANNPLAQKESFLTTARDSYENTFEIVAPVIAFVAGKGTDFEKLEEQAREIVNRIEKSAIENEEALMAARQAAEETVQEVRRIAQEAGVSQHAIHFKTEADQQEKNAEPWLYATIGIAAFTVVSGSLLLLRYIWVLPDLTSSQGVQVAIPKIIVFSVLLSATLWCGKTYRAYRHNAVVNRHRQNALATFQAFAKAASDSETKNAVLLQATQCIFSPQQTGYVSAEPEGATAPVLEIVRSLGKSNS